MPSLFDPVSFGAFSLPHRILMAPLTRCRAVGEKRVPNALMMDYYTQRAGAGLIFSEATSITPMGVGYPNTPGIWSDEHVSGWSAVTAAVHRAGGRMILQLWHVGRISDPSYLNGQLPVAPSAIAAPGHVALSRPLKPFVTPRALLLNEIPGVIDAYRQAAVRAKKAGFDGVEIHGANGYLLDQFLQDTSNQRTDDYGGSVEKRARLMLEVADAVSDVWGADHVGMHLSPRGDVHGMGDSNRKAVFGHVARELGRRHLAFLCTREYIGEDSLSPMMKKEFGGALIANEKFDAQTGASVLEKGDADAIAFGKLFISNPDLPVRMREKKPLAAWNASTFYDSAAGPKGYTDYPTWSESNAVSQTS